MLLLGGFLFLLFLFYYCRQGLKHLERDAYYAAVLAPALEVDSFVVVVDEYFGEEPLVVVEPLSPLGDGLFLYLARLLTHLPWTPPHTLGYWLFKVKNFYDVHGL